MPQNFDDGKIEAIKEFQAPESLYKGLISRVRKYHPSDDITLIEKAYQEAAEAHKDQLRKSGEPYIIHPLCVAIILADLEMDKETIAAGLLHDVVEDTILTKEEIEADFGADVALLVDGVTKLTALQLSTDNSNKTQEQIDMQAQNLRKMFLAMAKDIRVILIKLADRLHNMRTLEHMPPEKQQRIAQETLDIYSPIAGRLGISRIKVELDDLSLKYLKPDVYKDLSEKVAQRKSEREKYVEDICENVRKNIEAAGIKGEVNGRVKHFFSIYKKMRNQNKTLDQIYDLFAIRIIVDTVKDCYAALGVIHELYKPIPGRFKDYIAMPKPNMYQSLHTTLIGQTGQPFEIQIRTYDMHRAAEYGIAAHWKYKESSDGKKADNGEEEKLIWLRQILEWQQDLSDNQEFMSLLKSDLNLFSEDVYCFTPTGEVKNLPAGSTPIDFAYSIHSAVGNKMIGAKVNGKLVPIDYKIQNGDRIEVVTSQNSKGPSRDWLSIARSTSTKNKINQWFRHELKEENILKGKELLIQYCKSKGMDYFSIVKPEFQAIVTRKYGFHEWDAVLAAVGHGGLKEGQIINKILELGDKEHKRNITDEEVLAAVAESNVTPQVSGSDNAIIVKGVHDVAVRFSKCCNPVPGDDICGFVTRGRGVSIHRRDCINVVKMQEEDRTRLIEAKWQSDTGSSGGKYAATIKIFANNRSGLLADVSRALTEKDIDILSMNTRTSKQGLATMETSFQVSSRDQLRDIVDKIRQIDSVIDIERTTG
ncbi:MAG: bifunctional (p)ppGpp synthetase/guanosine-3',5'-bis(diphosphate) 3'-pyrophosphohydrolase [Butyrivibrio sp.]|nr:bifunctional (p)ppGpp synthetase/guanosine-3',5'-bis(diphosphate) 3'-pyrophosphohydrolase [Butyrivibrio sp.]